MEGWRQGRPGSKEDHSTSKGNYKTGLTLTGLLMEGLGKPSTPLKSSSTIDYRYRFALSVYCVTKSESLHHGSRLLQAKADQ